VCLSGGIWATQERTLEDHLLEAGGQRAYNAKGKVVVQALRASTVRIEGLRPARAPTGSTLRQALQQN
jgi:hypothetical protein